MEDTVTLEQAQKLAELMGRELLIDPDTNQWGGLENGMDDLVYCTEYREVKLVCTCMNCGDGSTVYLNHVARKLTE